MTVWPTTAVAPPQPPTPTHPTHKQPHTRAVMGWCCRQRPQRCSVAIPAVLDIKVLCLLPTQVRHNKYNEQVIMSQGYHSSYDSLMVVWGILPGQLGLVVTIPIRGEVAPGHSFPQACPGPPCCPQKPPGQPRLLAPLGLQLSHHLRGYVEGRNVLRTCT